MSDKTLDKALQRRKASGLTQARLKELLRYDPATGLFTWLVTRARAKQGTVAGQVDNGYVMIGVDGVRYQAHHLAYLYVKGVWCEGLLDHDDGDRANNRWANIREATRAQNNRNSKTRSHNKCGLKGVQQHRSGKWASKIQFAGKQHYLGLFDTPEAAHQAYVDAAKAHYGEFARAK